MKVAEILSDLASLRACDYNDALNLVTVNQALRSVETGQRSGTGDAVVNPSEADTAKGHLRLASELVKLHSEMKAVHKDGKVDEQLRRGREEVNRVLRELAGR
ncbi:hypothetical protein BJY00DRAFT_307587 [Aspergillus carlsbadensis]|nr:hypothetical protein BJY00DRAFT_307587 [Aspergillus carlsbadensis]